ncbi:diacylglycerol kinase family protein [Exiguobacterium sp. SL14]|nr:diacylglycerol kinase family protein [Exiguobacterium sp. SL14]MCY1690066.1 diacylglycerol kinase family protein [Exiguobacterium sp. SL14]
MRRMKQDEHAKQNLISSSQAGGDGTLNEVISGMVAYNKRPKLGVLPVGTTNDFGRAMRIPLTIEGAMDVICTGHTM